MPNKKKKVDLSQREKDTYMLYTFLLDGREITRGVYTEVYEEIAHRIGYDHPLSARRTVSVAIKSHYEPSLLDAYEFYNRMFASEQDAKRYIDKRK